MTRALRTFAVAVTFIIPATFAWAADPFTLTSSTFRDGDIWPSKYAGADAKPPACRVGENVSPPLAWSNAPPNTRSFALIMQDPDGGFGLGSYHWIAYDIPPSRTSIAEGEGSVSPTAWVGGLNGRGRNHYTGPCAPTGQGFHHYMINLIATDFAPGTLKPGLTHDELMQALRGHALGTAGIVGRYQHK